jgi:hypothetical protein
MIIIINILKRKLENTSYKRTRMQANQTRRANFPLIEEALIQSVQTMQWLLVLQS